MNDSTTSRNPSPTPSLDTATDAFADVAHQLGRLAHERDDRALARLAAEQLDGLSHLCRGRQVIGDVVGVVRL